MAVEVKAAAARRRQRSGLLNLTVERDCVAGAESVAIKQVHNEALSAYYQSKIGRPNARVAMNNGK